MTPRAQIGIGLKEWMAERGLADDQWRERLKEARTKKGYSQSELATVLGVSQQAVTDWETKRKALEPATFIRLAEALDTDASWIAFGHRCPEVPVDVLDRTTVRRVALALAQMLHRLRVTIDPEAFATQIIALSELLQGQTMEQIKNTVQSLDPTQKR
jgi:transcriptional regulator with XRE-family HTH domain